VLVTKTLAIAGEGGFATTPNGQRGAMLRAYDKMTGRSRARLHAGAADRIADDLSAQRQAVPRAAISGPWYSGELLASNCRRFRLQGRVERARDSIVATFSRVPAEQPQGAVDARGDSCLGARRSRVMARCHAPRAERDRRHGERHSGAVLPGVTVEVASDVLIEKTRSVSTDSQGEYKVVDLRPGTYVVTFSLQGFHVQARRLELPSNFTATINAEMKVGALEESVTVSGASPVVDVQTNRKTQVLSRDVLDAVPSAKTIQSLGQLIVGVTLTSPDVGGSRAMQQTYFAVHGVGASGAMVTVGRLSPTASWATAR
jgi:hypothetical protein